MSNVKHKNRIPDSKKIFNRDWLPNSKEPYEFKPKLAMAYLKYYAWTVVTKIVLGIVYISIIREGLVSLIPALGQRVSKIPMLSFFDQYDNLFRLDLGFFFAIFLMIAVFYLWAKIIYSTFYENLRTRPLDMKSLEDRRETLVRGLAAMILIADGCLFYFAMTQSTWGGSNFSFAALIATFAYLGVLIFVCLLSAELHHKIELLEH